MAIIADSTYKDGPHYLFGTDDDDQLLFGGGPGTPGGQMTLLFVGGGGDDVFSPSPRFDKGVSYNIYGDFSTGPGVGPAHYRPAGHPDHARLGGNDWINFGADANVIKGGRSNPNNGPGDRGDVYHAHGRIARDDAPRMEWFDPHEGDLLIIARDDVARAKGGGLGYRIEAIDARARTIDGEDYVEFYEALIGGFSRNPLIDQQWVRFGVRDDGRGGHERTLLARDPGDSVNDTVREWLWDHTGSGLDDFIL